MITATRRRIPKILNIDSLDLSPLGNKHRGNIFCPYHSDRKNPSLAVDLDRMIFHCFVCNEQNEGGKLISGNGGPPPLHQNTYSRIIQSNESKNGNSFGTGHPKRKENILYNDRKIVAIYDYDGYFEVVRTEPKGFFQRRPDGNGGYIRNLNGVEPRLYHQNDLVDAIKIGSAICIVEGEKDVDRLTTEKIPATCNPMGAGKWRDSYSETLRGADVVIIPDNDDAGRSHAEKVAYSCYGKVASIRIVELPVGKDVSEWFDIGRTRTELIELIKGFAFYTPVPVEPGSDLRDKSKRNLFPDGFIYDTLWRQRKKLPVKSECGLWSRLKKINNQAHHAVALRCMQWSCPECFVILRKWWHGRIMVEAESIDAVVYIQKKQSLNKYIQKLKRVVKKAEGHLEYVLIDNPQGLFLFLKGIEREISLSDYLPAGAKVNAPVTREQLSFYLWQALNHDGQLIDHRRKIKMSRGFMEYENQKKAEKKAMEEAEKSRVESASADECDRVDDGSGEVKNTGGGIGDKGKWETYPMSLKELAEREEKKGAILHWRTADYVEFEWPDVPNEGRDLSDAEQVALI